MIQDRINIEGEWYNLIKVEYSIISFNLITTVTYENEKGYDIELEFISYPY